MASPLLEIVPCSFREANCFVAKYHRHHGAISGCKFCVAVARAGEVVGVAMIGRPVSRILDDGWTLEVRRSCTDGTTNVNSMLYGAAWRAARALGYRKLVTYTLPKETGASLRAAGWRCVANVEPRPWNREDRPRVDIYPLQGKLRWER